MLTAHLRLTSDPRPNHSSLIFISITHRNGYELKQPSAIYLHNHKKRSTGSIQAERSKAAPVFLVDVDVPVVGGHAGITILPLLSKTRPSVTFTEEETEELTKRIQNAGTEVVEAKAGAGSATLSMAYAAARFVESSLRALAGDPDVYECTFIQSEITDLPFFASRVKLGKNGVESVISADLEGVTEYEAKALEALKAELKGSIEKGIAFANKQQEAAASV
jgi:malate dehydrogenase